MQDSHNEKWSLPLRTQHKVPYGRKVSDNLRSKITYIKKNNQGTDFTWKYYYMSQNLSSLTIHA